MLAYQIAECNEFIIAKIARSDFPTNWCVGKFSSTMKLTLWSRPTLITDLALVISTNFNMRYSSPTVDPRVTLMLRRSIKALKETLQELTSKKMLAGVKTMEKVYFDLHRKVATRNSLESRWSTIFISLFMATTNNYPRFLHLPLILPRSVFHALQKTCC
jgi:hypothetical protein